MREGLGITGMNESGFNLCRDESERAYAKQEMHERILKCHAG
jgi:hypothetical protein